MWTVSNGLFVLFGTAKFIYCYNAPHYNEDAQTKLILTYWPAITLIVVT